ncbi:MAG TPA: site-2 protease family protein [Bryobacteraceae bacterium]|nr:site-2 protease family protein [Bryobacteraceae bacterium]
MHAVLLLLTLGTTTVVGAGLARSFAAGRPFDYDITSGYTLAGHDPASLLDGLPFSLTLLLILMAHEMGHYLAARYYHVDATLPFFLPAPTVIGTFGAFIRIRSAIVARKILFDIGIGGPLAGFAMLILPMWIGVSESRVIPGIGTRGELIYGTPLILRLFERVIFPGIPANDIYLDPVARAAWVGLLATALNLLPIGQLDGGHVLYAFLGEKTRILSRLFAATLAGLGAIQLFTSDYKAGYLWLFWSALLFLFGMRHPMIVDPIPLSRTRRWLGFVALVIFILSFTPAPVRTA